MAYLLLAISTRGVQKDSIRYWPPLNGEYSTFDQPSVECRIFDIQSASVECRIIDIRNTLLQMSNIRHSKHPSSDRIFRIRSAVRRMIYIRHPKKGVSDRIFSIRSAVHRMSNIRHPKCVRRM